MSVALVLSVWTAMTVFAHGGDANLIHACVRNNAPGGGPNVRIVGVNDTCNANETAVDWPAQSGGGFDSLHVVTAESVSNNQQVKNVTVSCPAGEVAVSGGAAVVPITPSQIPFLQLVQSRPDGTAPPTGWYAEATSPSGAPTWKVVAYVVCG